MIPFILAQATQSNEGNYVTWLQVASLMLVPIVLLGIGFILSRLKRGDEKFDQMSVGMATLAAESKSLGEGTKSLAVSIGKLVTEMAERSVENAGTLGELKAAIAREYIPKREFERHIDRMDERFAEIQEQVQKLQETR